MNDAIILFLFGICLITILVTVFLKDYKWLIGLWLIIAAIISGVIPIQEQTDNIRVMDQTTGTVLADINMSVGSPSNTDAIMLTPITYGLAVLGIIIIFYDITKRVL